MPRRPKTQTDLPEITPCIDPEAREAQLIALTMDRVEDRIRTGQASSQELVHFLKLASQKESLEREKLRQENELLRAKTSAIKSQEERDQQYAAVIAAMMRYGGHSDE